MKLLENIGLYFALALSASLGVTLLCIAIFGGHFSIQIKINWDSAVDLFHSIKKRF